MPSWVRWGTRFSALVLFLFGLAGPALASASRTAYVLTANDAGITRVDLDAGTVTPGIAAVGDLANRIETGPSGRLAVVVNSGTDDVTLLNLRSETVLGTVALPPGSNPWTAEIAGGRVFVTCLLTNMLYEIDVKARAVVDSAATGKSPEGVTAAGGKLYVTNTGFDFGTFGYDPGSVTVLDLADLSPVTTVPTNLNPQSCRRMPDGTVHVVCTGDFFQTTGNIDVIDPAADAVVASMAVPGGFPGSVSPGAAGQAFLNVTTLAFGSEVWSYDQASLSLRHDASSPLLPSFDFYGELTATVDGRVVVPDFTADLLLVEDAATPGTPAAYLVGDGPTDVVVVVREPPRASVAPDGPAARPTAGTGAAPTRFAFAPVRPNPSRGPVSLVLRAPVDGHVTVTLFDVHGRRIRTLSSRARRGAVSVTWDGADEAGRAAPPGVYFARAESAGRSTVAKILRLR